MANMKAAIAALFFAAACGDNLPPDGSQLPSCSSLGCPTVAFCNADRTECRCLPPGASETVACDGTAQPDGGR